MKLILIFLFVYITSVLAQRKLFTPEASAQEPVVRSARGRSRFAASTEYPDVSQENERSRSRTINRHPQSRSRNSPDRRAPVTPSTTEADYIQRGYEVQEVVEDTPPDFKYTPNKVNSNFQQDLANIPLNTPLPSDEQIEPVNESLNQQSALLEETELGAAMSETAAETESYAKIKNEVPLESTSSRVIEKTTKAQRIPERGSLVRGQRLGNGNSHRIENSQRIESSNLPSNGNAQRVEEYINDRRRTRVRGNIESAPISPTTGRTVTRITRKNLRRNPDVTASTVDPGASNEISKRSRAGRKIPTNAPAVISEPTVRQSHRRAPVVRTEQIDETARAAIPSRRRIPDQNAEITPSAPRAIPSRRDSLRTEDLKRQPSETVSRRVVSENNEIPPIPPRATSTRRETVKTETLRQQPTETVARRSRSRSRFTIPVNEQELEVLPLFEREDDISPKKDLNRRSDTINTVEIPTKNTRRKTLPNTGTSSIKPRTLPTSRKLVLQEAKPITVKESVISHVSEVTSKRTITRKPRKRLEVTAKAKPREETKKGKSLTSSEEEIDDTDNYPEQFKALIQAKKQKTTKGTPRPSPARLESSTLNRSASPKEVTKKPILSTPRRFSPTSRSTKATLPTSTQRSIRSTTEAVNIPAPSSPTIVPSSLSLAKEPRFNPKTQNLNYKKSETTSTPKLSRNLPTKYSRKLYSSRKSEEPEKRFNSPYTTQIPSSTFVKSNRYSSRYRKNTTGAKRVGNAPVYQPTVPSIRTTTAARSLEDKILGLEVISFDDPVFTPSSANLLNANYTNSTQEQTLVAESQTKPTEKPKTLIEQIISSITAISTTQNPETITTVTTDQTTETTRPSTILKLATKKMPKTTDNTDQLITTEKPTTVIERILNSLSAIQSETTPENRDESSQVGSNYNTISLSTTPMSKVEQSTIAPSTPIVNNLDILDSISFEEILQQHTLESLLTLLHSLSSTTTLSPQEQTSTIQPPIYTTEVPSTTPIEPPTTTLSVQSRFQETETETETLANTATSTDSTTTTLSNEIITVPLRTIKEYEATTEIPTETTYFTATTDLPPLFQSSPLPPLIRFEVSPGSVSVFSANDLSVTHDDALSSTVTIPSRTSASTTTATPSTSTTTPKPLPLSNSIELTSPSSNEIDSSTSQTPATTTDIPSTTPEMSTSESPSATTPPSSTTSNSAPFTTPLSTANTSNQTGLLNNNNESTTIASSRKTLSDRFGLTLEPITVTPMQNAIETPPSTVSPDKDYYIFAVLNNNTILRKRPSAFPNKDTPFLIVGLYPNNTIVKKFPNGTIVPMEPAIRVSGFDTRANPPTLPEITNNQVTPDQGDQMDNTNLQMVEQNTISSLEPNALSANISDSDLEISTKKENVSATLSNSIEDTTERITTESIRTTTITSTTQSPTTTSTSGLAKLTELLNGNTVKAFNTIINISDLTAKGLSSTDSSTTSKPKLSNRILESGTTTDASTITTELPPTTPIFSTTSFPLGIFTTILPRIISAQPRITTEPRISTTTFSWFPTTYPPTVTTTQPTTTTPRPTTTTTLPTTTTTIPPTTIITRRPTTTTPRPTTTQPPTTTTQRPTTTTTQPPTTTTTQPPTTTTRRPTTTTRRPTTTTPPPTTTMQRRKITTTARVQATPFATTETITYPSTRYTTVAYNTLDLLENEISSTFSNTQRPFTSPSPIVSSTKKTRQLTKQQLEDLQTLARLESEQAAILKQLAFLNTLNLRTLETTTPSANNLANRIIALAVERSKKTEKPKDTADNVSEHSNDASRIEQILKDFPTASPDSSSYGKSNDAIIAELLKNQGIGPTTPAALDNIYSKTTTRKPKTTTRPRAPALMQGLRWLLNAFNPPSTTQKPKSKPKSKPKPKPADVEVLENQPTRITPVTAAAPVRTQNSLSQEDVKSLIMKLEAIQRDPSNKQIDSETKAKLQTLLDAKAVDVVTSGSTGVKSESRNPKKTRAFSSTTKRSVEVSNSVFDDDFETTTTSKPKLSLPPVRLNPVPGIEESDNLVRGQLVTAAINVTRALTQFLGSALQGAAHSLQNIIGSGSRMVGTFVRGSAASNPSVDTDS